MFQKTKEYLEQMHFSENLKIETEKYFAIETRGENVDFPYEMKIEAYDWGLPGKYFFNREKLNIKNLEIQTLNQKEYDALRASFGYPKPLQDLTEEHILIEASLDTMVDRNKGCYPGQEVIEKIYTYGRVARKIKKLVFENANEEDIQSLQSALPLEIEVDGNKVGVLSSVYHHLDKDFGLATLKRLFYEKHQTIQIFHNGKILNARIE
jgi:folate-binding protein YgfZ